MTVSISIRSQWKKTQAESREIHAQASHALFFCERTHMLLSPALKNAVTCIWCFYPEKLIRDSAFNIFTGGWSHLHSKFHIWNHTPNSRLQEGKKVFSISCIVYANSRGTENYPYQLGECGNTQTPASRPFWRQSQACPVNSFLHTDQNRSDND